MECVKDSDTVEKEIHGHNSTSPSPAPSEQRAPEHEAEEKTKRTRVQKREQELYGLITPVFLPLLDARDHSSQKEKPAQNKEITEDTSSAASAEHTSPARDAAKSKDARKSRRDHSVMEGKETGEPGEASKEEKQTETKKPKRTTMKKSALRQHNSRSRRKRVSLVIDGQTVLPADTVLEPPLTSPSSETTSASNSTTSLDDMIDPRLNDYAPEHHEAVHHSLPQPMQATHHASKPIIETGASLPSPRSPNVPTLSLPYNPPSTAIRTFLSPSPTHPSSLPKTAGPDPIYADTDPLEAEEQEESDTFHTYVGGLHGSGVDDVDQAGSYGYPSSLGASYLESYMQTRPLRVRMEAADRAGLSEGERREMLRSRLGKESKVEEEGDVESEKNGKGSVKMENVKTHKDEDEEMDFMGDMEDV